MQLETDFCRHWFRNFRNSSLFYAFENNSLNIPAEKETPGTNITTTFVLIGDGGYPLLPDMVGPCWQGKLNNLKRVYNYRLSKTRRKVECFLPCGPKTDNSIEDY